MEVGLNVMIATWGVATLNFESLNECFSINVVSKFATPK